MDWNRRRLHPQWFGFVANAGTSADVASLWHFDKLESELLPFDDKFAKEQLAVENVKSEIKSHWMVTRTFKKLYMVTGIRYAVG
jgi:hypothetical protein